MKILKYCLIIVICALSVGCSYFKSNDDKPVEPGVLESTPMTKLPDTPSQRRVSLPAHSALSVKGDFDLNVVAGAPIDDVLIVGEPSELSGFQATVSNDGTLHLSLPRNSNLPSQTHLKVLLRTHDLSSFEYTGSGKVKAMGLRGTLNRVVINTTDYVNLQGHALDLQDVTVDGKGLVRLQGVKSSNLSIHAHGAAHLDITGVVDLRMLEVSDQAYVECYWVNSSYLEVMANKQARIMLGGLADVVSGSVKDGAYYNGRYLKTQTVFMKTYHNARADLQVIDTQHVLAKDRSNIYFFHDPLITTAYMTDWGAVLDMQDV